MAGKIGHFGTRGVRFVSLHAKLILPRLFYHSCPIDPTSKCQFLLRTSFAFTEMEFVSIQKTYI